MTSDVTLAGYAVVAAAGVAVQLLARRARRRGRSRRHLTAGEVLGTVLSCGPPRTVLLAGWLWLGWHLFARVDWR